MPHFECGAFNRSATSPGRIVPHKGTPLTVEANYHAGLLITSPHSRPKLPATGRQCTPPASTASPDGVDSNNRPRSATSTIPSAMTPKTVKPSVKGTVVPS